MTKLVMLVALLLTFGGCKDKDAAGGPSAADALGKMRELKDAMCKCKDAQCAQDVSAKMTAWTQEQAKAGKAPKMTEADQKQAAALGEEMGRCMQEAMAAAHETTGSAPPAGEPGSAAPTTGVDGLPPECAEYKATVEKLRTCDTMPPKAKEALLQAYNDAAAGWANMPEAARANLGTSCKAGTQALVDAVKAQCGW